MPRKGVWHQERGQTLSLLQCLSQTEGEPSTHWVSEKRREEKRREEKRRGEKRREEKAVFVLLLTRTPGSF